MAEIRVQPKKGSLAWLWVLLLLVVVAAAVWFFYFRNVTPVPPTGALPAAPGVTAYLS
ncbi:MAG: hypothetical protein JO180_04345 [Gemmatirosa sp.]|nr:hypothetical protein [Gemmatirosa sp.]